MVFFSGLTTTYRYGAIDILAASIASQTHWNAEYILVDELYKIRKKAVKKYLEELGISDMVIHIPPKKRKKLHRIGMQNGRNTALLLAEGKYGIQFDDYTYMAPYCLKKFHDLYFKHKNDILLAIRRNYHYIQCPNPKGLITVFDTPFKELPESAPSKYPVMEENTGIHQITRDDLVLNLGCLPMKPFIQTGGYDERYDNGHGHDDSDLMCRMRCMGIKAWMDTGNINAHLMHPWEMTPSTDKNARLYYDGRKKDESVYALNDFNFLELRDLFLSYKDKLQKGKEVKQLPLLWDFIPPEEIHHGRPRPSINGKKEPRKWYI